MNRSNKKRATVMVEAATKSAGATDASIKVADGTTQETEDQRLGRLHQKRMEELSRARRKAKATPQGKITGAYRDDRDGIEWRKKKGSDKDGEDATDTWARLCNFTCRIIGQVSRDDGVETIIVFDIEARQGDQVVRFEIPVREFQLMNWPLAKLGAGAIVEPGQGTSGHLAAAILTLSATVPSSNQFAHTGWRQVNGEWVYLTASCVLGPTGPVPDIKVALPPELGCYELPPPPWDDKLPDLVQSAMMLRAVVPDRIAVPLLGAAFRAVLGDANFSVFLPGKTGSFKTELASLCQRFFGPRMDAQHLPANWESTANFLEQRAFYAKDAVMVVDDFVLPADQKGRSQLNRAADRVLRAQGNLAGRGRLGQYGYGGQPTRPPRGLFVVTGEEIPAGQSLRARLVILEVKPGDVDTAELTQAQCAASLGVFAEAMAGFISWLAPHLDDVRRAFDAEVIALREVIGSAGHRRTADAMAQLAAAWRVWLQFALEVGAFNEERRTHIEDQVVATLRKLCAAQEEHARVDDPVLRFFDLLRAVVRTGAGHIRSMDDGQPDHARALGWRADGSMVGMDGSTPLLQPQGPCIGWIDGVDLYLEGEASFAAVQKLGGQTGASVNVSKSALHARLNDQKELVTTGGRQGRLQVRKSIAKTRREGLLHIRASHIIDLDPS